MPPSRPVMGMLAPLHTGPATRALGFVSQGGTLSVGGMLFVNRATWAHCLDAVASLMGLPRDRLLTKDEIAGLDHRVAPEGIII